MDDGTRQAIEALTAEMRSGFAAIRSEMATKADLAELRAEMATKAELSELRAEMATKADLAEMRRDNNAQHAATRREFHVVAEHLSGRIDEVAEALQMLDEKVDRNVERLDDKLDQRFAETVALINWSHSILDARLSALE